MNFYPARFPKIFRLFFKSLVYNIPNENNRIFLTFDDGPTPEITHWVIDELEKVQAKATFFCIGNNIEKHPEIIRLLLKKQHKIANHSYNHAKGWKTTTTDYMNEVRKTQKLLERFTETEKIFRPPYGRITNKQINELQKQQYKIVMWSVVSGDFSESLNIDKAINYLSKKTQKGDILVFHDSVKAFHNLKRMLPQVLQNLKDRGFVFELL